MSIATEIVMLKTTREVSKDEFLTIVDGLEKNYHSQQSGFINTELLKFEYEVERVTGHCSCGYKVGDVFQCAGMNTPCAPFCGGAYMALFPIQVALHNGATFNFEQNPKSKRNLACPDNGYIVFKVTLIDD